MDWLKPFLMFPFLQHALTAALLIGLICPLVGGIIVLRKQALLADALSHVAFTGIAAGFLLQRSLPLFALVSPTYVGMAFAIIGAFFIKPLEKAFRYFEDLAVPILLAGAVGIGILFLNGAEAVNTDLNAFLFGSLLSVSRIDLAVVTVLTMMVFILILLFYKDLLYMAFDPDAASLLPKNRRLFAEVSFLLLAALVISASMTIIGILLVSSMMTMPVLAAMNVSKSMKQLLVFAVVFAEAAMLSGILISFHMDWSTGGTIAVVAFCLLLTTSVFNGGLTHAKKNLISVVMRRT